MGGQRIDNLLGVMQGRLLPKFNNRYQAHPVGYWQDEFAIAAKMGLDCIEFIVDYNDFEKNPLLSIQGRQQIESITADTGVGVFSICADYFMEAPLHSKDDRAVIRSTEVLMDLLQAAEKLKVNDIIVPCVDQSSIQKEKLQDRFCEVLRSIIPIAEKRKINLALETDLGPTQFEKLLTILDMPNVTVNYDIGNSAALGYDYRDELSAYGERISDVHIKDRVLGSGPVMLGTGNANIPGFFEILSQVNYKGPFIMQAYRDDEGVEIFKKQLDWIKKYLND